MKFFRFLQISACAAFLILTVSPVSAKEGDVCKQTGGTDQGTCQGACELSKFYYVPSADCKDEDASECCVAVEYTNPGEREKETVTPRTSTKAPATVKNECPDGFDCRGGIAFPKETGLSDKPVTTILLTVLQWILGIFGTIGVIAFVISGIQYLIAAGDEEMMEKGKNNMKYSIIGVIIGLVGLVIVTAIDKALNGTPFF